ncbi:GNAT family N-acetyltransferase [Candidatus Scalindua japonica]|uniref:GNAT family N-acetyltransferase n=1 Tax=Candidatus Scalindua japonica TaxID=1284222 RepID=UPI0013A59D98|nr:GNAT family N-acetyltransferase [Candidatus Scalindua japonica]
MISLPFCDTAGPLFDSEEIENIFISETLSLCRKIDVEKIEIRSPISETGFKIGSFPTETISHKVRMFLDLPDSSEKLLKSFKSKLRSQINKPVKEGLRFEWGSINKLNDFYQVFSVNMKELGSPVHSWMWFSSILEFYEDKVRMGLVYKGSQPVACGIVLLVNDTVTIPWASTLRKYNYLSPNMMLYWNFLAFASDGGYAYFDFGRSSPGESTYRFKAQWGGQPEALYWHNISIKKKKVSKVNTTPEKLNANREIATYLWRKLPLCVANSLGSRIRKYISL